MDLKLTFRILAFSFYVSLQNLKNQIMTTNLVIIFSLYILESSQLETTLEREKHLSMLQCVRCAINLENEIEIIDWLLFSFLRLFPFATIFFMITLYFGKILNKIYSLHVHFCSGSSNLGMIIRYEKALVNIIFYNANKPIPFFLPFQICAVAVSSRTKKEF